MAASSHSPMIQHSAGAAAQPGISVQDALDADAAAWDRYLESRPDGSFYHLFGWRRVLQSSLRLEPMYLLARDNGEIVGVLPLVLLSSRIFGRVLCSMPFLNYGGPCANSETAASKLIEAAIERAN